MFCASITVPVIMRALLQEAKRLSLDGSTSTFTVRKVLPSLLSISAFHALNSYNTEHRRMKN